MTSDWSQSKGSYSSSTSRQESYGGGYQNNDADDGQSYPSGLGSGNPKYWGFGNSNYEASSQQNNSNPDLLASSLSNVTVNAAKWAGFAKESVFKLSKTAADKATELTSKVSEQAKDGSLLTNVQSGVTNIASTVGKLGTKTWSDMQSLWSGKDYHSAHREGEHLQNHSEESWSPSASGYQSSNAASNSLPVHPSRSNNDLSRPNRDLSFESWLNDEPSSKKSAPPPTTTTTSNVQRSTKKSSTSKSKAEPTPAPAAPAANLISFDDENKWADDDDAGWEPIDTK